MEINEIKKYMKDKKITQIELSNKSGIPLNTIKQIFCGITKNPRLDTINAICKALNIDNSLSTQPTYINGNFRSMNKNKVLVINNSGDEYEYDLTKEQANAVISLLESFNNKYYKKV